MTTRRPCPPAPGPLEDYAVHFDPLLHSLAQRHNFRTYLAGLLAPRDRHKTLTALAGAEPLVHLGRRRHHGAHLAIARRRPPLLASSADGALVIDDTGDRKDGCATEHVARQYLGSVGMVDNGIVAVTTLWAHEQRYYPLHVMPYTPECRLADCWYGDNDALEPALRQCRLPYVLAHRAALGRGWAPAEVAHSFEDAARKLPLRAWRMIERRFRDGQTERWWAAELTLLHYGPDKPVRAVCVTTDRRALPELSIWYLTTNLPVEQAPLAEVARLYGLRNWIELGYKQMKDELGWRDFMVRSDRAIRRHWALVCCAFAFCWWHEAGEVRLHEAAAPPAPAKLADARSRKKNPAVPSEDALLSAAPAARRAGLVDAAALAHALQARLLQQAPANRTGRVV